MDAKWAYGIGGLALGLSAGFSLGYFFATRYEFVEEGVINSPEAREILDNAVEVEDILEESPAQNIYQEIVVDYGGGEKMIEQPGNYLTTDETVDQVVDFFEWVDKVYGTGPDENDPQWSDPYVISETAFYDENPEYEMISLEYYPDYDTLVYNDEILWEPDKAIGKGVQEWVKARGITGRIFVRNDATNADYEIMIGTKVKATGWIRDYLEGMDA